MTGPVDEPNPQGTPDVPDSWASPAGGLLPATPATPVPPTAPDAGPYAGPGVPADPYAAPAPYAAPYAATAPPAADYGTPQPYGWGADPYLPPAEGAWPPPPPPAAVPAAIPAADPYAWSPAVPPMTPPSPPSGPSGSRRGRSRLAAVAVCAACLLSGLAGGGLVAALDDDETTVATLPVAPAPDAGSGELPPRAAGSVAAIAAKVLPSVVALRVTSSDGTATGSGFVIRADGYILTNNHVVADAPKGDSVVVIFQDGTRAKGNVVGKDASYDLAVVRIPRTGLVPLVLADSTKVRVGDPVVAVGAPLGLQGTVTTGIVSALNRPVAAGGDSAAQESSFINAIQTDAAINPGNSGGPLIDDAGRVIGINSAIARAPGSLSSGAGSIGLGFAIPSNQARRTSEQLISRGKADHPIIGVLLDRDYDGEGVKVAEGGTGDQDPVTDGGPADKAGIRPGDVIVAFNGRPVAASDELVVAIRAQAPGDVVTLTVRRDGKDKQIKVTLAAADD